MKAFLVGLLIYLNLACWIYGILAIGKKIYEILVEYETGRIILTAIIMMIIFGIIGILLYHVYGLGYQILNYN